MKLDEEMLLLEKAIGVRRAHLKQMQHELDQMQNALYAATRKRQEECSHPAEFPGACLVGVCPHCGMDDY